MNKTKAIVGLFSAAFLATGCLASERELADYNEGVETIGVNEFSDLGNILADSAIMNGNIGQVRNLNSSPATVQGYDGDSYTMVEVVTETNRGAAMHMLDFVGGVNHPSLRPGARLAFTSGDYSSNGALHVESMNCAGTQAYAWDYDEPARNVELEVYETDEPDAVRVDYTTRVPSQNGFGIGSDEDVSSGSFVLHR